MNKKPLTYGLQRQDLGNKIHDIHEDINYKLTKQVRIKDVFVLTENFKEFLENHIDVLALGIRDLKK